MRQRKDWDPQEDALLLKLIAEHGERWRMISRAFTVEGFDRTDDALRNRYARIHVKSCDMDFDDVHGVLYTLKEIEEFINTLDRVIDK